MQRPMQTNPQRQVVIYDRNGKLVEEIRLPPPEVAAAGDAKQPCCLQLQVRRPAGSWDVGSHSKEVMAVDELS
jgi:hypothetical protein